MWMKKVDNDEKWIPLMFFDLVERNVVLMEETFATEPRPGIKLENTKETAPLSGIGLSGGAIG